MRGEMSERWLLLETSGRGGRVGLAVGETVAHAVSLDPARRHNRDLAPTVAGLLQLQGMIVKDLTGVMVSVGPGSYTGLRVGVMSAKALAYATGCRLVAVPTFDAIAEQTPADAEVVEILADALQGMAYVQRFQRNLDGSWSPIEKLHIERAAPRLEKLTAEVVVSGPGVELFENLIPTTITRVKADRRVPGLEALYRVGRQLPALLNEEMMRLEPLYLRGSSAEEQAKRPEEPDASR